MSKIQCSDKKNATITTGNSSVVVQQPRPQPVGQNGPVFMAAPQLIPGVPRGLEYVASVSSIAVYPTTRNSFSLCNETGHQIYFAYEPLSGLRSGRIPRLCIMDNTMSPVMFIHRPKATYGYHYECFVECPPGQPIGRVVSNSSCGSHDYSVEYMAGNKKLLIEGPGCCDNRYAICSPGNMAQIGEITRSIGNRSNVKFPVNLDVHLKASLLGAIFLIDWIIYDQREEHQRAQ